MKARFLIWAAIAALSAGCCHNSSETWENVKTAGRYMQRGVDSLWGKDYESRMLTSDEEFLGPYDEDFIPLNDSDLKRIALLDAAIPQPRGIPGEQAAFRLSIASSSYRSIRVQSRPFRNR